MKKGYFGIGIYHIKSEVNIGTLWRSAYNFGADFIFTIGKRYKKQCSDTTKAERHIPLYNYANFQDFMKHRPISAVLIGVEQDKKAIDIKDFQHPKQAIYLLGAEDSGLPSRVLSQCSHIIQIDVPLCLNVSVAGSIIMYDRLTKLKVN